jgi:hypothetical protein
MLYLLQYYYLNTMLLFTILRLAEFGFVSVAGHFDTLFGWQQHLKAKFYVYIVTYIDLSGY